LRKDVEAVEAYLTYHKSNCVEDWGKPQKSWVRTAYLWTYTSINVIRHTKHEF